MSRSVQEPRLARVSKSSDFDLNGLRTLAQRVRANDPSLGDLSFFRTPTDTEMAEFQVTVDQLARTAEAAAQELLGYADALCHQTELADLCGIVRAEIEIERSKLAELRGRGNSWELGAAAVANMSRLGKAAAAIENSFCDLHGIDPRLALNEGLETALAIRRAYARFWMAVPDNVSPVDEVAVELLLRRGATAIAGLIGRHVFLDLRATDRRLLLECQARIRQWLASGGQSEDGGRLWSDFASFARLMRQINQRAELVEYDLRLLPELQSHLAEMPRDSRPLLDDSYFRERVRRLMGRFDALDDVLSRPNEVSASDLLVVLGAAEVSMLGSAFGL